MASADATVVGGAMDSRVRTDPFTRPIERRAAFIGALQPAVEEAVKFILENKPQLGVHFFTMFKSHNENVIAYFFNKTTRVISQFWILLNPESRAELFAKKGLEDNGQVLTLPFNAEEASYFQARLEDTTIDGKPIQQLIIAALDPKSLVSTVLSHRPRFFLTEDAEGGWHVVALVTREGKSKSEWVIYENGYVHMRRGNVPDVESVHFDGFFTADGLPYLDIVSRS